MSPLPSSAAQDENSALDMEKDDEYYLEMMEFEVENIIYMAPRVHWAFVTIASDTPDDMNVDPTGPSWPTDASTSDVYLFFGFIDLCFESYPNVLLPKKQWIRILLFATVWGLDDLRRFAALQLDSWIGSDLERVTLGREYEIPSYLDTAFRNLVSRPNALTPNEVQLIGLVSSAQLVHIREKIRPGSVVSNGVSPALFQEILDCMTQSADTPSHLNDSEIIGDIKRAKLAGIKEWLREGYKKLISLPEGISSTAVAALELTQECTQSLLCAQVAQWSISRNGGARDLLDWNPVVLAIDQAVAHSFDEAGTEAKFDRRGELDLVTQLALAVEHRSRVWLQAVYGQVLIRHSPMTVEEAKALGCGVFGTLAGVREGLRSSGCSSGWMQTHDLEADITRLAYDDLDAYLASIEAEDGGYAKTLTIA